MSQTEISSTVAGPPIETGIYAMHRYIYFWQIVFQWIGWIVGALMVRGQRVEFGTADVQHGTHYVLAMNHQTYLDPLVVPGRIPRKTWQRMGTPRALMANRFFEIPVLASFWRSIGAFPAKEHAKDPYGLEYASHLLERGQSVMIFPEGGISLHREREAHKGVMVLAQQPHVKVIPVHLEWKRPRWRLSLEIGIGKPFDAGRMSAQEILDRVYATPVK